VRYWFEFDVTVRRQIRGSLQFSANMEWTLHAVGRLDLPQRISAIAEELPFRFQLA
jgi:hypothetical protein